MDKAQALHSFWSSFDLPAIDEQSAYDAGVLESLGYPSRYITYEVITSNLSTEPVALTASIWDRSTSWAFAQQKADEIAAAIGYGGKVVKIDGGYLWIKLGQPFAQRMADENNYDMRRIYLTISAEFLTAV